jgi:copper chaperone CopZ
MNITKQIQNLKCGGCAHTIISSLEELNNIDDVNLNIDSSEINFICLTTEDEQIVYQELKNLGYPVIEDENTLSLKAKSYISCAIGKIKK